MILFYLSHVVTCAEIKVYLDILYSLVQHEEGIELASNARSFFPREGRLRSVGHHYDTFVKCNCVSSSSVLLKQQLVLESQHDEKRFNK